MLTDQQKVLLDSLDIDDVIDHYSVAAILSHIDSLHAIVIYGLDEIFLALERYEDHSPR